MRSEKWATWGWLCLVLTVGIAAAVIEKPVSAQAGRQQVPQFEPDPLFTQALPNKWMTGEVGGVAVDTHDHYWIFHRVDSIPMGELGASFKPPRAECCIAAPPVLEFDQNGKFVQGFGGPGQGYDWPTAAHGIFVDHKDNVWLSGNSKEDNQILKFTNKGKFIMQIGHKAQNKGSNDTENLGGPAGLFVHKKTNELLVADGYFNHRVIVFDAETGKYKRHWGAYGKPPDDTYKFPPRAELVNGPPPPQFNNPVHSVVVSNDDIVYVADRSNNRVQSFTLDGKFIKEVFNAKTTLNNTGTAHGLSLSPDSEQRFLYLADGSNMAIRVLNRKTMEIISSIGGHGGHNAREFFHIHSIATNTDSKGNLWLGEVNDGQRYYRYKMVGMGPVNKE